MNPITLNHFGRRTAFIQMLRERGARLGVEIGTDHGQYAQQLLEGIPYLQLYCVDPWLPYTEGNSVHGEEEMEQIYKEAYDRVVCRGGTLIRETSMEAVENFEDDELDFVFIDGNHTYEHALEDITEWSKKVKPGGIIAGHDYKADPTRKYGVIEAVQNYTKENHIAPWFILHAGGKLVDCFMWIKS